LYFMSINQLINRKMQNLNWVADSGTTSNRAIMFKHSGEIEAVAQKGIY
jgi:glycerol kinase